MADPLLYKCDVHMLHEFLDELENLTYGIDHPITIDADQAIVTIGRKSEDEDGQYHVMSVTAKE